MTRLKLLVVFLLSFSAFAQYEFDNSITTTSENITAFSFATDNVRGIAVANNGYTFKTLDEGVNWAQQNSVPQENGLAFSSNIIGCQVLSLNDALIATQLGQIFKSTDTWVTWNPVFNASNNNQITDVAYTQSGKFVCVREQADILWSDDEGLNWDSTNLVGVTTPKGIDFDSGSGLGVAVGASGTASRSWDNGGSWGPISIPTSTQMNDVAVANSSHVIAVGAGGTIFESDDSGDNWTQVTSGTLENLVRIDMYNNHGIIVGENGTVLETDDWGDTWVDNTTHSFGNTQNVTSVLTLNSFKACIGGVSGKVDYAPAFPYNIEFVAPFTADSACVGVGFDYTFRVRNEGPQDAVNPTFNSLCNGGSIFIGSTATYNGTIPVGDTVYITFPSIFNGSTGNHAVWLYAVNGSDILGFNTTDYTLTVGDQLPYNITNDTTFCLGDTIEIKASGADGYFWSGGNFQNPSNGTQEVAPTGNTTYYVELEQPYCVVEDSVVLTLDLFNCLVDTSTTDTTVTDFAVNYAFSPNNDGVNDILEFDFININALWNNVSIYNRWGDEVYHTNNYNNADQAWDGVFNQKPSPAGTYFYVAQTSDKGTFTGWVQIVK